MFTQVQEKRAKWQEAISLPSLSEEEKKALHDIGINVFGTDPTLNKKTTLPLPFDALERIAELDTGIPALKAELKTVKGQSHDALVGLWAEKLRKRSDAFLAAHASEDRHYAPIVEKEVAREGELLEELSANMASLRQTLVDTTAKLPAVIERADETLRSVTARSEKRQHPSLTEQIVEEERARKRQRTQPPPDDAIGT